MPAFFAVMDRTPYVENMRNIEVPNGLYRTKIAVFDNNYTLNLF